MPTRPRHGARTPTPPPRPPKAAPSRLMRLLLSFSLLPLSERTAAVVEAEVREEAEKVVEDGTLPRTRLPLRGVAAATGGGAAVAGVRLTSGRIADDMLKSVDCCILIACACAVGTVPGLCGV